MPIVKAEIISSRRQKLIRIDNGHWRCSEFLTFTQSWRHLPVIETKPWKTSKATNQTSGPSAVSTEQRRHATSQRTTRSLFILIPLWAIPSVSRPCSQDQSALTNTAGTCQDPAVNSWLNVYARIFQTATSFQALRLQFCIHFSFSPSRYIYSLFIRLSSAEAHKWRRSFSHFPFLLLPIWSAVHSFPQVTISNKSVHSTNLFSSNVNSRTYMSHAESY